MAILAVAIAGRDEVEGSEKIQKEDDIKNLVRHDDGKI